MSGKLAIGGLVAVAVMALSAGTASAHPPGYGYGGGFGGGYYGRPVVVQPVYRPVAVYPQVIGGYPWGNFGSPGLGGFGGGYNSGFYNRGFNNGFYGRGFNNGFGGFNNRPSFGLSFNFIR